MYRAKSSLVVASLGDFLAAQQDETSLSNAVALYLKVCFSGASFRDCFMYFDPTHPWVTFTSESIYFCIWHVQRTSI
jgi:hypothetical protein